MPEDDVTTPPSLPDRQAELERFLAQLQTCQRCHEAGYGVEGLPVRSGRVGAQVMTIGQAPGVTEIVAQRPFNAGSGRRLFQWLGKAGWPEEAFRAQQYMSSVTKCYPGKQTNGKGDRVPTPAEQALCRPNLLRELELIDPLLIIPIGTLAIKLFFPPQLPLNAIIGRGLALPPHHPSLTPSDEAIWFDDVAQLPTDWRAIIPLPHPSGASLWPNQPENKRLIDLAITLLESWRKRYQPFNPT